jgi:hypothetical protein
MHSKDRHWCAFALVFGSMLAFCLALLFALFALSDYSLQEVVSGIDWSSSETYLTILTFVALGVAFVRFFIHYAVLARRREACRMKALTGISDAMPAASPQPEAPLWATVDVLELDHEPLTLRWANGSTITASRDGLLWRRPKKRDVLLAWSEARLLELWEAHGVAPRKKDDIFRYGYCLYATADKYVEWTDAVDIQIAGERKSWKQKERLQEELLAIVTAHTRLPLRVVARRRGSQRQKNGFFSQFSLEGVLFFLAIPVVPLGTSVLAILAPLTHSPALNSYTAATLGIAGLMLLRVPFFALRNALRPLAASPLPAQLPPAPALAYPDAPIAIKADAVSRPTFLGMVITALVVGNIYPLLRSFQDYSTDSLTHDDLTNLPKLAEEGLTVSVLLAFLILLVFCVILFSRPTVLLADETGLHWGKAKK